MAGPAPYPLIRHVEDWRAIVSLNAYRGLVAFGLVAVLLLDAGQQLFELTLPDVFRLACLLYLLECVLSMTLALWRRPALRIQVVIACAVDIAFFTCLTFASNGVAGGLGMLLIAPLAAAGMLLPGRIASLLAACAVIGILGQEALRLLQFAQAHGEFVQAGILGALFFLTVSVSHWLARRARVSEALAARQADELRDLAELNRRIIGQMEMGAVVVDSDRRIRLINDAAIQLLGADDIAAENLPLARVSAELDSALQRWLDTPQDSSELLQVGAHTLLPVFSRLDSDALLPALIFLENAQRQREQAQQLKLVSIGRLTASIAHEIRNPLGAISHAGQLMAESDALGDPERRMLDIIHRHARRIDAIVTDVLGLSRRSQSMRQVIALRTWLEETIGEYRQYSAAEAQFDITGVSESERVEFDPAHLRQVLVNLWDNSSRYARRDDRPLKITLARHSNRNGLFCLDIIDNGPGLDEDTLGQVMEPFFTTARDGTGLGLHIAGELCEANGARLVPVAQTDGACFRITFARAWSQPANDRRSVQGTQ